ncbi:LytTR family DNA-binding domain-containing protein [Spirosoma aerolatum]|uniref:LytTR family DNA-binding domain-containing protein n=1 Tax=Spirosoma aerolatum TaxID=1211326 RepID=UPI0009AE7571|nr:LytTR family DNA-binding domain-containing protein [Spirosoma aerolatum]
MSNSLEAQLLANQFVRIHRSFIVAVSAITSYAPRHVKIAGLKLPIGRLYQKDVERILDVSKR